MKKNILGASVFFSLLALAALSVYIYAARTGSGQRLRDFNRTAGFLEERVAALEKQRDLLSETAIALDGQASTLLSQSESLRHQAEELSRRVRQIDGEITIMADLIGSAREAVRPRRFSIRGFRLNTGSGLVIIAFLAFIWLLYTSLRTRAAEEDAYLAGVDRIDGPDDAPVTGSVVEEEFPTVVPGDEEPPADEEEPAAANEPPPPSPAEEISADDSDAASREETADEAGDTTPADAAGEDPSGVKDG